MQFHHNKFHHNMCDLHVHSDVSDGLLSCEEILVEAKKRSISQLVFTDHNCFHDNLEKVISHAKDMGIFIPFWGCECTTVLSIGAMPMYKIHILVFGHSRQNFHFLTYFPDINGYAKMLVYERYLHALNRGDVKDTFDNIYRCRQPIFSTSRYMFTYDLLLDHIVECGMNIDKAKELYPPIRDDERYRVWADTENIIKQAHNAGCVCVWAHPGWIRPFYQNTQSSNCVMDILPYITEKMLECGIDGIEVWHQRNMDNTRKWLLDYANQKNLFVTGGSDYHAKPGREIGCYSTSDEVVNQICHRLELLN